MAYRIDSVVSACKDCSAFDKLVATAMAQNGDGFNADAMKIVANRYRKVDGSVKWDEFFRTRTWKGDISDIRAFGRENYDTRYMIYLYTCNLYVLHLTGWKLPNGITKSDLLKMARLGWRTNDNARQAK